MHLFFVDAETDGLYGSYLSVAMIVTDENCNEIDRRYIGIRKENLAVTDSWVKEHVLPIMGDYEAVENEETLLEEVWQFWEKYRDNAYAIGDVIYPVEARLFQRCIEGVPSRKYQGPFPFLDLSSLLYANGYNPLTGRSELLGESEDGLQHNAIHDVEVMVAIFKKLEEKGNVRRSI